jgi:hypothetical protein
MRIHLDGCAGTDKDWHLVERHLDVVIPASTFEAFSCEEVDPRAFWQVNVATVAGVHDGADEELTAEIILIVDVPHLPVIGMTDEEGLDERQSAATGLL